MSIHKASKRDLFFCKWRDEDGREKRRYFKTEQQARAFEAERLQARTQEEERLTLGELTMLYFKSRPDFHIETKRKIVHFLAGHDRGGKHHTGAGEFLRDKYAESLNRHDLERMREGLRAGGAGNNTLNKYQAYIRAILAWGVDQDLIHLNPWRDYKRLKVVRPVIGASVDDLRRLYPELPAYLQWAVKTAFFLALRPGQVELFGLTWDAFNWRRGVVIIRQGKSGKLKTVVPHPSYMQEARERYDEDMAAGIPLVCHRGDGRRVLNFRTAWTLACKRAGVTLRPYDIRHIAATEMLARGADLAAVAAQLGHSNVATTGGTYAHV
ncbi:MAG: tyrosine-type recombinase/integrase, partial [Desulfovibrio sp.]|nr:tyrosine-type recombinase/integrase [Desulfovibrio sp.]